MKIRLISYRDSNLFLYIEKKYTYNNPIISLGSDCHPSYVLRGLNLRNRSFPFDWLNTTSFRGIDYVNKNINDNFASCCLNLVKNNNGYVISRNYEDTEFYHYPDIIENPKTLNAFYKKTKRFIDYFNNKSCVFLFNVKSEDLVDSERVSFFLRSVNEFHQAAKGNHRLLIYIRYDESFHENESYCNLLEQELNRITNTYAVKYIRYKDRYGIWGDEKKYAELIKSFGIKLKLGFPRIYLSNINKDNG